VGFIKDGKINALVSEAQRAIVEGRTVFTPRLNTPTMSSGVSGSVSGWAEMIEAVEACGWVLSDWTVTNDEKHRPGAYPLFRRR
jgi:hypothetical protein